MSADVICCSRCGLPETEFLPGQPFCRCLYGAADQAASALRLILARVNDYGGLDRIRDEGPIDDAESALEALRVALKGA